MKIFFEKHTDDLILFFIFTGIVSLYSEFLTTPKTISGICLYLLLFYKHIILKRPFLKETNKKLLIFVGLFFLSLFVSAIFSEMPLYSLHWIKKSYWVSLPLGFAIISVGERALKVAFAGFVTIFVGNVFHFYFKAVRECHTFNPFSPHFVPDRNFTIYLGILLPFAVGSVLVFRNIFFKLFLLFNILLSFLLLFPIGSRGGYVVAFLTILLWIIFSLAILWKKGHKKSVVLITFVLLLILTGLGIKFRNHPKVKAAIQRGISPNGRDVIIKDRFFVIFKEHPILGLGYGRLLYFNFLEKHHVPKRLGHYDPQEKRFVYYSDEGLFLQTIIRQGVVGLLVFIPLFFYSLKLSFLYTRKEKDFLKKCYFFSIFIVLFAHYLIRGLVETLSLTYFFPLVLSLALSEVKRRE